MKPSLDETALIFAGTLRSCYNDGRKGAAGYPQNPAEYIADYIKRTGKCTPFMKRFITQFVEAMNAEYKRGQREGRA